MAGNTINVQGSYIDVHDNEHVYLSVDKAEVRMGQEVVDDKGDNHSLPEVLAGSELWQKAREAGFVGDDGQPTVSRTEAALLADFLAERLGIAHKWKFFEELWHRNNMRGDYNTALEQKKSLAFQDRLKMF